MLTGRDFHIVPKLTAREGQECMGEIFRYFEIGDVTREGAIVNYREDYFENLPTRARLQVQTNDVLFAKNISSGELPSLCLLSLTDTWSRQGLLRFDLKPVKRHSSCGAFSRRKCFGNRFIIWR